MKDLEELVRLAVDCGLKVHKKLGPGLLESVYETIVAINLRRVGIQVERQKPLKIEYDGLILDDGFRIDLLLDGRLIIEVKSVETLLPVHGKQLLTYLRLTGEPLGLLMNFGNATFREGLRRVVNNHVYFASSRLRVHQISTLEAAVASEGSSINP